ncbi:hypothetical protein GOODEAATRI_033868 [Goodea atripinnis]|uniref:Uncharacterized protein n=1 Tax=Goodea atripinnis TaxID=208336 RepID=A0ABV0NQH5_9TELE
MPAGKVGARHYYGVQTESEKSDIFIFLTISSCGGVLLQSFSHFLCCLTFVSCSAETRAALERNKVRRRKGAAGEERPRTEPRRRAGEREESGERTRTGLHVQLLLLGAHTGGGEEPRRRSRLLNSSTFFPVLFPLFCPERTQNEVWNYGGCLPLQPQPCLGGTGAGERGCLDRRGGPCPCSGCCRRHRCGGRVLRQRGRAGRPPETDPQSVHLWTDQEQGKKSQTL